MLGKHIYGYANDENQLKVMFERHGEREEIEKKIYDEFTMGRKISLSQIVNEHRLKRNSQSPPNPYTFEKKMVKYSTGLMN